MINMKYRCRNPAKVEHQGQINAFATTNSNLVKISDANVCASDHCCIYFYQVTLIAF